MKAVLKTTTITRITWVLICVNCCFIVSAQSLDNRAPKEVSISNKLAHIDSLVNWNFMVIPTIAFQPETNWTFGAAGAYYFKIKGQEKTSDFQFDVAYTLNKQINVNLLATTYFGGNNRWFMYTRAGFKRYPYLFYGIGNQENTRLETPVNYSSDNIYLTAQPQYYISKNWIIGANMDLRWEHPSTNANLDSISQICDITGLNKEFFMLGIGSLISYDSRNKQFYPNRGLFFKSSLTYYEPYLGSSYRLLKFNTDVRQYITIYKEFIFAWQAYTDWTFGHDKPFQYLPTLGGMDMIRGVSNGEFRDDVLLAVQTELRIPIWRFLKAAVFASMGDVYNLDHWQWSTPKIGYGAGLRIAINKAKVNIRFDVARQNYNNKWSFYLTLKEAF